MSNVPQPDTSILFSLYNRTPLDDKTSYRGASEPLWVDSPLSRLYFCPKNVKFIQNSIQQGVYQKSNGKYKIGNQDGETLNIIMKSIYLSNVNNYENKNKQLDKLNQLVLAYCIPQIYDAAQAYMHHIDTYDKLVVPMERPVQVDVNDKTLREKFWF